MIGDLLHLVLEEHRALVNKLVVGIGSTELTESAEYLFFVHLLVYYKLKKLDFSPLYAFNRAQKCRVSDSVLKRVLDAINLELLQVHTVQDIFLNIPDSLFAFTKFQTQYLLSKRKLNLAGLDKNLYEHPWDRRHLVVLKAMKGLDYLCKKVTELGIEPYIRVNYTGTNIQVSPRVMPELYALFAEACSILDLETPPDFYIEQGFINAFTVGCTKPLVVLQSGTLSALGRDELLFIIGHELGHIKSMHMLYHMVGDALPMLSDMAGKYTLGISNLLSFGLRLALSNWKRMSEFTADRAGLLCCQNIEAALSVFMKLGGLPLIYYRTIKERIPGFIEQAETFESLDTAFNNKLIRIASIMNADHPWMILRAKELLGWYKNGEYERVLSGGSVLQIEDKVQEEKEISKIRQIYDGMTDSMSNAVSNTGDLLKTAGSAVGTVVGSVGESMSNAGSTVSKAMGSAADTVSSAAKKLKFWR